MIGISFLILDVCLSLIGVIHQENFIRFVFPNAWILQKPSTPNFNGFDLLYLNQMNKGTKEQRNNGTKEQKKQRNKGTMEQRNKETREQKNE